MCMLCHFRILYLFIARMCMKVVDWNSVADLSSNSVNAFWGRITQSQATYVRSA
jgi:hypothetical protein